MHTYARIDSTFALPTVMEIIEPATDEDGNEIPVAERFTSAFVSTLIDVTTVVPQPACWWTYSGGAFSPPTPV
jgi:carbonic anhydrase